MNDLNQERPNLKEKLRNIYSIHLDKARIFLVTFVVLTIITGTFLIGLYVGGNEDESYDSYSLGAYSNKLTKNKLDKSHSAKDIDLSSLDDGYDLLNDKASKNLKIQNPDPLKRAGLGLESKNKNNLYVLDKNKIRPLDPDLGITEDTNSLPRKDSVHSGKNSRKKFSKVHLNQGVSQKRLKGLKRKTIVIPASHNTTISINKKAGNGFKKSTGSTNRELINSGKSPFRQRIVKKFPVIKGYQIQVASFKKLNRAAKLKKRLVKKGISGNISAKVGKKGIFYRISFGAGNSIQELEKRLVKLRRNKSYQNAFIIKM